MTTATRTINKVVRPGTIPTHHLRRDVFLKIKYVEGTHLSISGVIGPRHTGNAWSCGQIDMEFAHRDPADNDSRYTTLIRPSDFVFAKGWTAETWLDLLDTWSVWHLKEDVPTETLDFLDSLPDTDKTPAWV